MERRYGYRPDTHDKSRDLGIDTLFGSAIVTPSSHTMAQWVDYARDQQSTSECVAFALARCFHIRAQAQGHPIDWPSTPSIYFWARDLERQALGQPESVPLQDTGCIPMYAVQGCTAHGVPRDQDWPFSVQGADDEPTQLEVEVASAYKVDGFRRIDGVGALRVAKIKQAIGNDYPVMICKQVDKAFEDYASGVLGASDPSALLGGHATCLFGFDQDNNFLGVNSYGPDWGVDVDGGTSGPRGFYTASDAFVLDALVGDVYAIVGSPVVRGGK
jgi:hypothetical protein